MFGISHVLDEKFYPRGLRIEKHPKGGPFFIRKDENFAIFASSDVSTDTRRPGRRREGDVHELNGLPTTKRQMRELTRAQQEVNIFIFSLDTKF